MSDHESTVSSSSSPVSSLSSLSDTETGSQLQPRDGDFITEYDWVDDDSEGPVSDPSGSSRPGHRSNGRSPYSTGLNNSITSPGFPTTEDEPSARQLKSILSNAKRATPVRNRRRNEHRGEWQRPRKSSAQSVGRHRTTRPHAGTAPKMNRVPMCESGDNSVAVTFLMDKHDSTRLFPHHWSLCHSGLCSNSPYTPSCVRHNR